MSNSLSAFWFILMLATVLVALIYRKKVWALLLDLAIGTVVYMGAIFFVSWLGLRFPIRWAEWGYPILMISFVAYHILSNISRPSAIRPYGAL